MDNNDSEQKAALGIIWTIVGVVVIAMLFLAGYFGITAGKGVKQPALAAPVVQEAAASQAAVAAQPAVPPTVKIFFETGKSEVPANAAADVSAVVAFLKANPAATVAISGYHDASGNADVNAEVSKERAKSVRALLVMSGVEEARVTLDKPQVSLGGNDADARRVEVTVHQ
ncbi:ompA family protein [Collimonas arenae]|uniref:OmpA family protein n=1 Tax=Collimonas arenae TaxID=279058 RepID=A0A127PSU7_9BURK|nr:OmpA family protein [Collimonas arenae]AMP00814.1 ompA family protein [Collimonas arenae]AMP10708.1 ompA family protein [Collimonas arenae]